MRRGCVQDLVDDSLGLDALGFGVEVRDDAVLQDPVREGADVVDARCCASIEEGTRLGAENQELARPWSGSPGDVFLDEIGGTVIAGTACLDEGNGMRDHRLRDGDPQYEILELQDLGGGEHRFDGLVV